MSGPCEHDCNPIDDIVRLTAEKDSSDLKNRIYHVIARALLTFGQSQNREGIALLHMLQQMAANETIQYIPINNAPDD